MVAAIGVYERWSKKRLAFFLLGWLAMGLPVIMTTWDAQAAKATAAVAWVYRPLVAADALTFYVTKVIFPSRLLIDYGATPRFVLEHRQIYFALGFVCLLAVWLWRKRKSGWWLAAALMVAGLAPVLGFIPFEFQSNSTVADRYMYMPLLGVCIAVAMLVESTGRLVLVAMLTFVTGLSVAGYKQVKVWSSGDMLFSHTLEYNPGSLVAWQSLGAGFMAAKRWPDAINAFTSALALRPRFGDGLYNLGLAYEEIGLHQLALEQFRKITTSGAPTAASLEGAARSAKKLGLWDDAKDAIVRLEQEFPGRSQAAWLMAELQINSGDFGSADRSFREAIRRQPNGYELRTAYGDFLSDHGDPAAAVAEYKTALKLAPNAVPPRINLAVLLASVGRTAEAESELIEAIRIDPKLATAYVNYGYLLEKNGRLLDAARAFEEALKLEPGRADAQAGWARVKGGRS